MRKMILAVVMLFSVTVVVANESDPKELRDNAVMLDDYFEDTDAQRIIGMIKSIGNNADYERTKTVIKLFIHRTNLRLDARKKYLSINEFYNMKVFVARMDFAMNEMLINNAENRLRKEYSSR